SADAPGGTERVKRWNSVECWRAAVEWRRREADEVWRGRPARPYWSASWPSPPPGGGAGREPPHPAAPPPPPAAPPPPPPPAPAPRPGPGADPVAHPGGDGDVWRSPMNETVDPRPAIARKESPRRALEGAAVLPMARVRRVLIVLGGAGIVAVGAAGAQTVAPLTATMSTR